MAVNRNQNGPHVFQGSTGAPTGYKAVVAPAFSMATTIEDIKRHLLNMHRCGLWHKCLHADLLDGYHVADIFSAMATELAIADLDSATPASGDLFIFADISDSDINKKATLAAINAVLDHGTLAGLGDDDHSIYLLASAATSRAAFASNWTDLTDAGATTLHKHDHGGQDGLTDDDHSQYLLAVDVGGRATFNSNWTDLTDAGATTLHKHAHDALDGLADDDHTQYHNDSRGDARYLQKSNDLSDLASDDTAISNLVAGATSRTPTELHEVMISDINAIGTAHGRCSVAALRQEVVTADNTLIHAFGSDSTDGPWRRILSRNFTTGGAGALETAMTITKPAADATILLRISITSKRSDALREYRGSFIVGYEDTGGTLTADGTDWSVEGGNYAGSMTFTFDASGNDMRIRVTDPTTVMRLGIMVEMEWRTSSA